jgi:hypothetical protein
MRNCLNNAVNPWANPTEQVPVSSSVFSPLQIRTQARIPCNDLSVFLVTQDLPIADADDLPVPVSPRRC